MKGLLFFFVLLSIVIIFIFTFGKSVRMNHLAILLQCKEYELFDQKVESLFSKLVVRHYDLEIAKLNSYILRKDDEQIDLHFNKLIKTVQDPQRKQLLLRKVFEYYTYEINKNKAAELLKVLKETANKEESAFCQMEYDILIGRKSDHIPELIGKSGSASGQEKILWLYLLQLSYENAGNKKEADKIRKCLETEKNI